MSLILALPRSILLAAVFTSFHNPIGAQGNHPSPKLAQIQTAHENVTKTLMQDYAPQGKECVQSFLPCLNKCASTRTASLNQLFGEFDEDEDWEELGYHIPRAPRGGRKKKIPVEQFFDDEDLSDGLLLLSLCGG